MIEATQHCSASLAPTAEGEIVASVLTPKAFCFSPHDVSIQVQEILFTVPPWNTGAAALVTQLTHIPPARMGSGFT